MNIFRLIPYLFVLFQVGAGSGAAEDPAELKKLRVTFQAELKELNQPIQELNEKYQGYLDKRKAAYQKDGNLEAMLVVDGEKKSFVDELGELSSHPELKRLQEIYREQRKALEGALFERNVGLIQAYGKKAGDLSTRWTKENRIDDAKLALEESKRFAKMETDPKLMKTAATSGAASGGEAAGNRPGEEKENSIGMKLCWIPAGRFTMGSPGGEEGRNATREDQVRVKLTRGFWLAKFEVTQGEYEKVVGTNPSRFKEFGERGPVDRVSWEEAMAFCEKLTASERQKGNLPAGWTYTLPTEAQWEYACRAGSKDPYSGGKPDEVGWYKDVSGDKSHEVGKKTGNAWGLHDMHGNLWEWCLDWFEMELPGGEDPAGPESGSKRAFRGGAWYTLAKECRAASRQGIDPKKGSDSRGFRVSLISTE